MITAPRDAQGLKKRGYRLIRLHEFFFMFKKADILPTTDLLDLLYYTIYVHMAYEFLRVGGLTDFIALILLTMTFSPVWAVFPEPLSCF